MNENIIMIALKKITEKNTKKQILEEHSKALQLINQLEQLNKQYKDKVASNDKEKSDFSIDHLIEKFDIFSNDLNKKMGKEVTAIAALQAKIVLKRSNIENIYETESDKSLDEIIEYYYDLINTHNQNYKIKQHEAAKMIESIEKEIDTSELKYKKFYSKDHDTFNLNTYRLIKEDKYNKIKFSKELETKRHEIIEKNQRDTDNLNEKYHEEWLIAQKSLEQDQEQQKNTLIKVQQLKDNFEKTVSNKVNYVVSKQKNSYTQELKNIQQDYGNKITLKNTELNNWQQEEQALNLQIEALQKEFVVIQDKAHILATKTIDSKSTAHSFQAMKAVAMEQAKGKK